jgi:7,8-dihydro-6-hydroxymethylpterin-pyrophosphokinase
MKQVCLSLGANIGDAKETLRNVVTDLFVEEILVDIQVSSMYETYW